MLFFSQHGAEALEKKRLYGRRFKPQELNDDRCKKERSQKNGYKEWWKRPLWTVKNSHRHEQREQMQQFPADLLF
jgi:hypothetical protein